MAKRGSAMVLVIVLILIGGIFFSITLSYHQHIWLTVTYSTHDKQALWLAESGIKRIEYFLNGGDGKGLDWQCESFEEKIPNYGSISLTAKPQGFYTWAQSTGKRLKKTSTMESLLYRTRPEELEPVITLTGHIGGMVIDHKSTIDGNVVLHHGSVKQGKYKRMIPGSSQWTITKEMPALPFEKTAVTARFADIEKRLGTIKGSEKSDSLVSPTENDTITVNGSIILTDGEYKNCLFVGSTTCILNDKTTLTNCKIVVGDSLNVVGTSSFSLFFADKAMSVTGDHHSQFFSKQSIVLKESKMGPLSLYSVYEESRDSLLDTLPLLTINTEQDFTGTAITVTDSNSVRDAVFIEEGTTVKGSIVTNGSVRMRGVKLDGSLWCHSVLSEVDNVMYKNWLWDCQVTEGKQTTPFPLLGSKPITVLHWSQNE